MGVNQMVRSNKTYIIIASVFIVIFLAFSVYVGWQNIQLHDLKTAYSVNQGKLEILQKQSEEYLNTITAQKKTISALQLERNKAVKEAVQDAYEKGTNIPDSDVLDAWKRTILRSRERNAERQQNITVD